MSVISTSTTDQLETKALGDLAETVDPSAPEVEEASGETAEESETSEEQKPKKKGGFQRRIDKLNSRVSLAEQEKEYWREQALKLSKQEQAPEKKAEILGKPKSDEFDSHDDYVEALVDWKAEQKLSVREAKQKESQVKSEHQKLVEAHVKRVEEFSKTHQDFHDLLEDVDDIPMSITVQEVILSSENGPELMYELAKNPEELKRISGLSAIAAARELGKFESRLEKKEEVSPIKTTKAPPPIQPVGAKSTGSVKKTIYDPDLSQRDYEKLRAEQLRR